MDKGLIFLAIYQFLSKWNEQQLHLANYEPLVELPWESNS